ncbi:hypothetical protein [Pinibacter soli]|uniref:Glycoside hydrolase family 5 domain-containing protein n=1 Tax=Pinibacter soli TaxID=3044211 RepID=A0ABT6R7E6_9BACT|nr:hypothetical protein [Pinibacter soli]MDI3318376.1 hypothetical protein [Pinibacter soli]
MKIKNGICFLLCLAMVASCVHHAAKSTERQIFSSAYIARDFGEQDWKGLVWAPYNDCWRGNTLHDDAMDISHAGIKWVRVFFRSDSSDAALDLLVQHCNDAGVKIIAAYKKSYPKNDLGTPGQQLKDSARLAFLVARYKNNIHYWEIHNEPNLHGRYWELGKNAGQGSVDPEAPYNKGVHNYVQWLKLAYNTIKLQDANATVVLGGLSSYMAEPFVKRLTAEQAYQYFDEVAYHPYATTPDKVTDSFLRFKAMMKTWPAPKNDLPVWITEIGFFVGKLGHKGLNNEAEKAQAMKSMYEKLMANMHWKRPICWYLLHEEAPGKNYFNLTGLDSATGRKIFYPAYDTLRSMNKGWSYYKQQQMLMMNASPGAAIHNDDKGNSGGAR